MTRFALALVFLALVAENQTMYVKLVRTPLRTFEELFFAPSALKLPIFFFVVMVMLFTNTRKSKEQPALIMKRALKASVYTILACSFYGILTGGEFKQVPWQTYNYLVFQLFAMVLVDAIRTPANLLSLGKVIVAAAVWRSLAALTFYITVVRPMTDYRTVPPFMTTHDDTTLFCTGVVLVGIYALHAKKWSVTFVALAVIGVSLVAIQLNNRRLAWVSLAAGFFVAYCVLPQSPARSRINKYALILAPILGVYVAVGWGRSEKIFKPLKALDSMDAKKDSSTASREVENDNLIETAGHGYLLGTGFGHPFDIINPTYELDGVFEQWKYIPHNSYLGLLAFSGVLGFAGIWWPMPVSVYLSARSAKGTKGAIERTAAAVAVSEVVIFANQAFGDMGFESQTSLVLLASGYAAATRVAIWYGGWPTRAAPQAPAQPAPAAEVTPP